MQISYEMVSYAHVRQLTVSPLMKTWLTDRVTIDWARVSRFLVSESQGMRSDGKSRTAVIWKAC